MPTAAYLTRRSEIETYFDRTAVEAWRKLTSDAPVGRIRATVRAGRDRMRTTLLERLPMDLSGRRVLDAGCGTGALAVEVARRGAEVVAVDLSPTLVELARERMPAELRDGRLKFVAGDMLDPAHGTFDHIVAMDSLIHYRTREIVAMLTGLSSRAKRSILYTVAPRTPALTVMHTVGRLFPRGNRAPSIVPVTESKLHRLVGETPALEGWRIGESARVDSGFYLSHAQELIRR